ncbi:MAG: peptide chain release factor-like protein [Candidatus Omnitrophota bacterium]|jgi:protein subunit release factor B|nr:peptide chain release factor-like protein [Candidatus Omnitrophota bacterium]
MDIFGVSHKKEQALREKMSRFSIKESDLEERFIRSRGPGGQNVNKVSTGVYLKHLPSNVEAKVCGERSQALNRYAARKILVGKIENMVLGRRSEERKRIEKIRRQKRKRSKRAKEKMLDNKRMHSQKKGLRKRVEGFDV